MQRKNLVYLVRNDEGMKLVDTCPAGVTVNETKKTWMEGEKTYPLGTSISDPGEALQCFGVYNRMSLAHLNALLHAGRMMEPTPASLPTELT